MSEPAIHREMTPSERRLVIWMLEQGNEQARKFLPQVDQVKVSPWQCECGCASMNFTTEGQAEPTEGIGILGDYLFGTDDDLNGIFIFEQGGFLSGIEVYGLSSEASRELPFIEQLRPFSVREG